MYFNSFGNTLHQKDFLHNKKKKNKKIVTCICIPNTFNLDCLCKKLFINSFYEVYGAFKLMAYETYFRDLGF